MLKKLILLSLLLITLQAKSGDMPVFTAQEQAWLDESPTLRFSEVDWRPLTFISDDDKFSGMIADYMRLITDRSGITFELVPSLQWSEALDKYDADEIDLLPAISDLDKMDRPFLMTDSYVSFPFVIVADKGVTFISETSELNGLRVAVGKGYTSQHFLQQHYPEITLVEVNDVDAGLKILERGKVDFFVGHLAAVIYALEHNGHSSLKIAGKTEFSFKHRIGVDPQFPHAVTVINKVFGSISDKEHNSISEGWITTYRAESDYTLLWGLGLPLLIIFSFFAYRHNALHRYNMMLKKISEVDKLTQMYTRLKIDNLLDEEHYKSNRYKAPLSVILFDIDDFKSVNDMHGHQVGDQVLQEFARITDQTIRKSDSAGRWGGEEFLVISPHTNKDEAYILAEHLREAIEAHSFLHNQQITASFGVATYIEGEEITTLIGRVDKALYTAKRNGKNIIIS